MTPEELKAIFAAALAPLLETLEAIRLAVAKPRNGAISPKTMSIAATKSEAANLSGTYFLTTSSGGGAFSVQFDGGEKFSCLAGLIVPIPQGFSKVTIFNDSTTDQLDIQFIVSNTPLAFSGLIGG